MELKQWVFPVYKPRAPILFLNYLAQATNLYNLHNVCLKDCSEILSKIIYLEFLGMTSVQATVVRAPHVIGEVKGTSFFFFFLKHPIG